MFCAFFYFLIYYSLANKDKKHSYSTDKLFNDQIQRKLNPNKELKEIVCPEIVGEAFTEITDGVSATGNHYACNQRFKKPISISNGLLQIYHCKFIQFKSSYSSLNTPISITGDSNGRIYISNCQFFVCEQGCIYLNKVNAEELKITNCYFTRCVSTYDVAIIQFNSNSGTIENCYFHNNYYGNSYGTVADIYYNPSSIGENDRLK